MHIEERERGCIAVVEIKMPPNKFRRKMRAGRSVIGHCLLDLHVLWLQTPKQQSPNRCQSNSRQANGIYYMDNMSDICLNLATIVGKIDIAPYSDCDDHDIGNDSIRTSTDILCDT